MVSHEFRTPLGIIMSSADILQTHHDELDPSERRDQLDSLHKNIRRMAALMEEVLFLGQVEAGKLEFKPVPVDLRALSSRLVDEVNTATHRRCPIEFAPENLPAGAFADERLLNHILQNLLSNAVKYSHAGSPVEFSIRRDDTFAVCAVRDSGIGIPEADRSWLFNAFHRGRNVGDRPGTGLGLVIVKRCVDLHGGTIEVESRTGEGTTVIVRLPVFPPVTQPQPVQSGSSRSTIPSP
jgi:signal transduction histidine kinase